MLDFISIIYIKCDILRHVYRFIGNHVQYTFKNRKKKLFQKVGSIFKNGNS